MRLCYIYFSNRNSFSSIDIERSDPSFMSNTLLLFFQKVVTRTILESYQNSNSKILYNFFFKIFSSFLQFFFFFFLFCQTLETSKVKRTFFACIIIILIHLISTGSFFIQKNEHIFVLIHAKYIFEKINSGGIAGHAMEIGPKRLDFPVIENKNNSQVLLEI